MAFLFSYSAASIGASMSHLYPGLLASGLDVLFLSGDDDGYVPSLGTRSWLGALKQLAVVRTRPAAAAAAAGGSSGPLADQHPWVNQETGQVHAASAFQGNACVCLSVMRKGMGLYLGACIPRLSPLLPCPTT